jgi:hypothetical protein
VKVFITVEYLTYCVALTVGFAATDPRTDTVVLSFSYGYCEAFHS